ncbi:hypothetical protein [Thioalkalivibrio sp. ALE16]|uniref:hypothetical protein n=1 Tax=Thioalkalivibrio sp. ALE16 TaxID=1158172 RepID=UPI00035D49C4|nr:hypothetical protein [Thioalkalivibrio sp. ALE16]
MSYPTSGAIRHMMRNPRELIDFETTGRVPRPMRVESPLIDLLRTLSPRDRMCIEGIQLSPELGYHYAGFFRNAEVLLRWLEPDGEVFEGDTWPAESWRDKRFRQRLTLADLKPFVANWPEHLDT